jgi:membrane-bound serine protease (ClpP class)
MLLLVVGVIGIWIELKTPGFGVPGIVGIASIGLLIFGNHLAGLAQATDIVLIVLGVALVMVELFFFPGVGAFAILGVVCIIGGLILSFQGFTLPDIEGAPWEVDILFTSMGRVLSSLAIAVVGFLSILRFLPRVPLANRLVLQSEIGGTAPVAAGTEALAGQKGHAVTALRPGGKVDVAGQVVDVVAEGEFVAPGEPVEVLRVEGMRVVVGRTKR